MSQLKKPKCPICGLDTSYQHITIRSTSSEPSSLAGGESTRIYYKCDAYFDVCWTAVSIYNSFIINSNISGREIGGSDGWRDAIKRYNHYIDFVNDNNLKQKLLVLADDELNLKKTPEYLFYP